MLTWRIGVKLKYIWFSAWISSLTWVWLTACGRDLSQECFLTQVKTWKWDKLLTIGSGALCIILWEGKMLHSLSCGLALPTAICERQFWGHGPHTQAAVPDGNKTRTKKVGMSKYFSGLSLICQAHILPSPSGLGHYHHCLYCCWWALSTKCFSEYCAPR